MGLSLSDFDALTPAEFDSAYRLFERTQLQEPWERVRFLSTAMLSPWSKKGIKPTDVVKFPWDNQQRLDAPQVNKAEAFEKFNKLKDIINERNIHSESEDSGE